MPGFFASVEQAIKAGFESGGQKWAVGYLLKFNFADLKAGGYREKQAHYNFDRARATLWTMVPDGVGFFRLPNNIVLSRVAEDDPDKDTYAIWELGDVEKFIGHPLT